MTTKPTNLITNALATAIPAKDPALRKAYAALKSLIQKRFAEHNKPDVLNQYEEDPEFWKAPLEKLLNEVAADRDKDILKAAETLIRVERSKVGVLGDNASIEGGIHFGNTVKGENIQGVTVAEWIGTVNQYIRSDDNRPDPGRMRTAYLYRLFCDAGILFLEGIDPKTATCDTESRLNLAAVYTALLTRGSDRQDPAEMMSPHETRRISALEIADRHQHTVLLGDPGSGKTTFVNFVTLCLAGECLGHPEANLDLLTRPLPDNEGKDEEERQPWEHGPLLPVRIILRDFAAGHLPDRNTSATELWQFITHELKKAELSEFEPHLKEELREKGGLLMLDGLDEVPEADNRRVRIRAVVEDFMKTFHRCRVLVTSRTYAYQKQDWRIPGLHESVLAPFSEGQIRRFVDRWYAHFAELRRTDAEDAQGRAELLKRAVFGSRRLRELATRPLLLTLMASLHAWRGGTLPDKREQLYDDTVDLLLDWWESRKVIYDTGGDARVMQPSLTEWLRTDREKVRDLLNELAYKAHESQPELHGTADISEGDLVSGLMRLAEKKDVMPKYLMEHLGERSGLLLPRGVGVYSFPHRTFQEYLAACHLTDLDFPEQVADLCRNDPNRWREVCLLAGAKTARGGEFAIWALADALCHREPDDSEADTADLWGAHIAGQALAETADLSKISPRNQKKLERVRGWLLQIIQENLLPATERALAGNNLACLGDPRITGICRMMRNSVL
ncbi:NACHT domain-containing protein [Desulfobacterales bacterium HSG2]|nr:NACHT domain-containing protein [Desulfobacterales bacterium HSG2]